MKRDKIIVKANVKQADGSMKEQEVARVDGVIVEATLDELLEVFTDEEVATLALRKHKQDCANKAREDWRNGGKKAARDAHVAEMSAQYAARLQAGEMSPTEFAAAMVELAKSKLACCRRLYGA